MRRLMLIGTVLALLVVPTLGRTIPAQAAHAQQQATVHVVRAGETLTAIARAYHVTVEAIARANNLLNPDCIYAGQRLVIPAGAPYVPPPATGGCEYLVQPGDTLSKVAQRYGTTVQAIMAANGLSNPDYIAIGQKLIIPGCVAPAPPPPPPPPAPVPTCGSTYIVQPGDTLSRIAAMHHTTVQAVAQANGLRYPYLIFPGQRLFIPCGGHPPAPPPKPKPTAVSLKPAACPREIQIVRPLEGQHVSGVVQLIGTASIPNFQFYKLEYAIGHLPLDNSAFKSINEVYTTPVVDTVLGVWYVGNMPQGPYTVRLTAVDKRGQFPRPCDVHIFIDP